jgi:hypothetical protein
LANGEKTKENSLIIVSIVMILLIFILGYIIPNPLNWAAILISLAVFLLCIGKYTTGEWWGILINERNKIALSRFQLVLWTLIVISALLAVALLRIKAGSSDPLSIALPQQLWELLGISTTALVGSPLILNTKLSKTSKKFKEEHKDEIKAARLDGESLPEPAFGILAVGDKPRFSDMFLGDEDGNKTSIDMAKVQMFFFTLIIVFSYAVLLFNLMNTTSTDIFRTASPFNFPALDNSLVALLGISSAGYLANKTYDKTKTN